MSRHSLNFTSFRRSLFLFLGSGDNCDRNFPTTGGTPPSVWRHLPAKTTSKPESQAFPNTLLFRSIIIYREMVGLLRKRDSTSNKYLDSERLFDHVVCNFYFMIFFIYFFFHNLACCFVCIQAFVLTELKTSQKCQQLNTHGILRKKHGYSRLLLIWRIWNRFDDNLSSGRRFNFYCYMSFNLSNRILWIFAEK